MNEPNFSRGYLRLPLMVWGTVYCRGPLTRRQLQLVSLVIRESWGWQRPGGQVHLWTRPLSPRQFAQATGLSTDHLRRDLNRLLERGVLRERQQRYQFVGDVQLWKADLTPTLEVRPAPPEWPVLTAETAPADLASKKSKRKQRNVVRQPDPDLSTTGENSSSPRALSRSFLSSDGPAPISATAIERLVDVVAAFVGSLSPREADALRLWIYEVGVAAVWAALEPAFRLGPTAGRERLQALLRQRTDRR